MSVGIFNALPSAQQLNLLCNVKIKVLSLHVYAILPTGELKRSVAMRESEKKRVRGVEDKPRESSSENREQAAYPCVIIER